MKNVLRSFVVLSLIFGMALVGCGTDDDGNNGNGNGDNTPKVVAEQYRGEFHQLNASGNFFGVGESFTKLVIGETTLTSSIVNQLDPETTVRTVYTDGNKLFVVSDIDFEIGKFEDTSTFKVDAGPTYKRPGTSQ